MVAEERAAEERVGEETEVAKAVVVGRAEKRLATHSCKSGNSDHRPQQNISYSNLPEILHKHIRSTGPGFHPQDCKYGGDWNRRV